MITFQCLGCGQQLTVEEDRAGLNVTCFHCNQIIRVPHIPPAGEPPAPGQRVEWPPAGYKSPSRLPQTATGPYAGTRTSGKAIASLVLGIVSLFCFGVFTGTLAVVYGVIAQDEIRRNPSLMGSGLATAGIVIGIIGFVGHIIVLALLVLTH
jgi:DNA-directed RNA polymerase subunit RPC12/RpoP